MSNLSNWAKSEVELACRKINPNRKDGEFDYVCACYDSALKAYESLCEDGHSGYSIKMTQMILNRLIDHKALTPIEDIDDAWSPIVDIKDDGRKVYQCGRMSSLFKTIYPDGTVKYSDNHYTCCVNIDNPDIKYHSGLVHRIINEMYPITMPYMPPDKPIKVYCEEFLTDKRNGDFDTLGVFYAIKTENDVQNKIEINRFFRESEGNEKRDWIEISKEEYEERKAKKLLK